MDNYELLVERIARSAGIDKSEVERKIEAKKAKLSGLISREGAAQIVASELGVNLDQQRLKIAEVVQGMRRVNLHGKIIKLNPVREFNKNGREGKVASFVLADDTANIRVVLWDTNHIALIEEGKINEGDFVEIFSANLRNGEIHLTSFSDIKLSNEKIEGVVTSASFQNKKIEFVKQGENVKVIGTVVKLFEPRYFEVCPECRKRVVDGACGVHGKVEGQKRVIVTIVIDDGTASLRAVMFEEQLEQAGAEKDKLFGENAADYLRELLEGEEFIVNGQIRNNEFFNTLEIFVESVEKADAHKLVEELQKLIEEKGIAA